MADDFLEFDLQLDAFTKKVQLAPQAVAKRIAFDLFGRIIKKTPVDTGRARGSWTMAVNEADLRVLPPAPKDRQQPYPSPAPGAITLQPGDKIIISNNLPYIGELEHGHSQQAPDGMVELSIQEIHVAMRRLIQEGLGDAGLK